MTWSPVCWRHQAVRTAWSSVLWHSFEFSVEWHAWETSYAIRSKKFTCLSGHLTQCFQDLFDFICTSLSALNSHFALFKTTRVHKRRLWSGFFFRFSRLWAFQRPQSLIRRKSNLKISYVNKTFQKKPEHYCSPHVYIANEIFFLPTTCST